MEDLHNSIFPIINCVTMLVFQKTSMGDSDVKTTASSSLSGNDYWVHFISLSLPKAL